MTLGSYGNGKKHGAAESHILKNTSMGKLHCCVKSAKLIFCQVLIFGHVAIFFNVTN